MAASTNTPPSLEVGSTVLSGDSVDFLTQLITEDANKVILGPGLRLTAEKVTATKCGLLKQSPSMPHLYWIENHQKRYVAERNDDVIGIVTNKTGDTFRVDIGASEQATISFLAFEGATQKNRPQVQIGDLLYAKLLLASKDMEPELVCVDSYGKSKGLLGVLSGGFVMQMPLHLIRKLRAPGFDVQRVLAKLGTFEIALGMNGRVWIKANSVKDTIAIANAISLLEFMRNDEIQFAVEQITNAMCAF
uniref:Ribosomal RNA-processing protein 40 n=1 Tax=Strigamia maritima TaxID=126957 RepID=T1JKW6_STRMM